MHIQVTGIPRSGTTLLMAMINNTGDHDRFKIIANKELSAIHFRNPQDKTTICKRPLDLADCKLMSLTQIFWIIVVRDIRDVITSYHPNVPDKYFTSYDYTYHVLDKGVYVPTDPGIKCMYEGIKWIMLMSNHLIIHFEDLINRPDYVQNILKEKANIIFKDSFSNYHKYKFIKEHKLVEEKGLRNRTGIGRWKELIHHDRITDQMTKWAGYFDYLIRFSYEDDKTWFNKYIQ